MMPTIAVVDGIRIVIYFRDHDPPHFHARQAEHEILVEIARLRVIGGACPAAMERRRHRMGVPLAAGACVVLHIRDASYFNAIVRQLKGGGLEAMLFDLLQRDLSSVDVRAVPLTEELRVQKLLSLPSLERWWLAVLSRGFLWARVRSGQLPGRIA